MASGNSSISFDPAILASTITAAVNAGFANLCVEIEQIVKTATAAGFAQAMAIQCQVQILPAISNTTTLATSNATSLALSVHTLPSASYCLALL